MRILTILIVMLCPILSHAQQLIDRAGKVHFYSSAPLEDIEADNGKVLGALDLSNGQVAVTMRMQEFEFEKSLMQEHFNENYIESEKYPKSIFSGKIDGYKIGMLDNIPDNLEISVAGKMEIHGVSNDVTLPVTVNKDKGFLKVHAVFMVKLEDYEIEIPKMVMMNIAEEVEVTVDFSFESTNK